MTINKLKKKLQDDIRVYTEVCCSLEMEEEKRIYNMGLRDKAKEVLEKLGGKDE